MNVDSIESSDSGALSPGVSDSTENPSQSSEGSSRVTHAEAEGSSEVLPYAEETVTENQSGLVEVKGASSAAYDHDFQEETLRKGIYPKFRIFRRINVS
ncbi:MAG TPA: hypothetical protein VN414_07345 [Methanosarcina sp.]|nr:hypothetical protein [Methanosarcina sp.]